MAGDIAAAKVEFIVQPSNKTRYRYESDNQCTPLYGESSDGKQYPTIQVSNYEGEFAFVASLVTIDDEPSPFSITAEPRPKPHPNTLVGDNCKDGLFMLKVKRGQTRVVMSKVGIFQTKQKDVKKSLELREKQNIDPYRTGFRHGDDKKATDLSAVRICVQVIIPGNDGKFSRTLGTPICSNIIHNSKSYSELVITDYLPRACANQGGKEMILLTSKLTSPRNNNGILYTVRFFEKGTDNPWSEVVPVKMTDIHQNAAIRIKVPEYTGNHGDRQHKVFVELRKSGQSEECSEEVKFLYFPDACVNEGRPNPKKRKIDSSMHLPSPSRAEERQEEFMPVSDARGGASSSPSQMSAVTGGSASTCEPLLPNSSLLEPSLSTGSSYYQRGDSYISVDNPQQPNQPSHLPQLQPQQLQPQQLQPQQQSQLQQFPQQQPQLQAQQPHLQPQQILQGQPLQQPHLQPQQILQGQPLQQPHLQPQQILQEQPLQQPHLQLQQMPTEPMQYQFNPTGSASTTASGFNVAQQSETASMDTQVYRVLNMAPSDDAGGELDSDTVLNQALELEEEMTGH